MKNDTATSRAEYTSSQRGASPYVSSYTFGSVPPPAPPKKGAGRVIAVTLVAVLCLALCFGAGMAGSLMTGLWTERDDTHIPLDEQPSTPPVQSPEHGTPSDDPIPSNPSAGHPADADGTQSSGNVGGGDRTHPVPDMDKSESLGDIDYSGSAGDAAYSTLAEAIDRVDETVVEIFTETIVNGGWLGNYVSSGAGSGVIISENGYIVTNEHVISGASSIQVRMTDGTTYEAQVVGSDAATDIAVLWVDTPTELAAAQLGCSADLIVGESVFAIGNPLGSLGGTVTDGIISATARAITVDGQPMTLLQTNAAVNPGNSGGGLFNMAGQLVGVVNAKASENNVEGLGFAIPIDTAYEVICQLMEYGYVRGVVDAGLELYDVSTSNILVALRYFGMSYAGVYILESDYSDEIMYGDLLVSVGGTAITTSAQAEALFAEYAVGDTVELTLLRLERRQQGGREVGVETTVTVELVLQEYVPEDVGIRFEASES